MTWAVGQKLPALQKLVLLMLANRTNPDTGQCFPSIAKLAEDCGMSRSAVKTAMQGLRDKNVVQVFARKAGNESVTSNLYLLKPGVATQPTPPVATQPGVGRQTTPKQKDETLKEKEEEAPAKVTFDPITSKFEGLTTDRMNRLKSAHPGIDIANEVSRAELWMESAPPSDRDCWRFLISWVGKAHKTPPAATKHGAGGTDRPRTEARPCNHHYRRTEFAGAVVANLEKYGLDEPTPCNGVGVTIDMQT